MSQYWDYSGLYGEEKWSKTFPIALRQSPINISSQVAVKNEVYANNAFTFSSVESSYAVLNKGNNVSFKPISNETGSCISGGPLDDTYCFEECHMHWGRSDNKGCEHEIDGKRFDAELHLVHRFKKCSFPDALNRVNGLCVLGVFIEVADDAETPTFLENLIGLTEKVHYKGDNVEDSEVNIEPYEMLRDISNDYFTYEGSLTTPPLSECVRWIVFKTPLTISRKHFGKLQNVVAVENNSEIKIFHDPFARNDDCCDVKEMPKMGDNYRKCLSCKGRKIECSF